VAVRVMVRGGMASAAVMPMLVMRRLSCVGGLNGHREKNRNHGECEDPDDVFHGKSPEMMTAGGY
jgi:hypothetical protein